jgi:hypothetical protein
MLDVKIFNPSNPLSEIEKKEVIDFLHNHLDQFRDTKEAIGKGHSICT